MPLITFEELLLRCDAWKYYRKMQGISVLVNLGVLLLIFGNVRHVRPFSAGVPPLRSVCTNMLPHHHEYKPQGSEAPYEIVTSTNTVAAGGDVVVTLKSNKPGTLFRGFYMQARDENSKPIGSFTPNDDAKTHSCIGMRNNAAHHANGKVEKPSASVTWTAPKDYTGEVIFISTFVKDFVNIWAGVYSEAVTVTPFVKQARSDNQEPGGIAGLIGALGINIPGFTSQSNANTKSNDVVSPTGKK